MAVTSKLVDFEMLDAQGRKLGARVTVNELYDVRTWALAWDVKVQVMRDGVTYGARTLAFKRFTSKAEAAAEVRRRLNRMITHYTKLAEGCHAKWMCKDTGRLLTLRDITFDGPHTMPYMVVCEEHATCMGVASKVAGRRRSALDFCDGCRDAAVPEETP